MEEEIYWLWLSLLNISVKARAAVITAFGSAEAAFHAPPDSFSNQKGITAHEASLLEVRDLREAKKSGEECARQGIRILPITDSDYPKRLKEIFLPPVTLFVKGILPPIDELPVISVIGTRSASPYGLKMGESLSREISLLGGTSLSLLTTGVDEAAARGALQTGMPCVAVLGTPHENYRGSLMRDVAAAGAVISEYPPGRERYRYFFRERNRIAAGLSVGVAVVEAPEGSGTMLFVRDAVEQGKDIFAVPGNADARNSAGTLLLLKEGAKLVTTGAEILEEYELRFPEAIKLSEDIAAVEGTADTETETAPTSGSISCPAENAPPAETPENELKYGPAEKNNVSVFHDEAENLTEDQKKILLAIREGFSHVDDIAEEADLTAARTLAQLTVLEIKGMVRREAGRRFSLREI